MLFVDVRYSHITASLQLARNPIRSFYIEGKIAAHKVLSSRGGHAFSHLCIIAAATAAVYSNTKVTVAATLLAKT